MAIRSCCATDGRSSRSSDVTAYDIEHLTGDLVGRLVVSDAHQGLENAATKVLGATWQRWRETADRTRERFPKFGDLMDSAEAGVLAFMGFPEEHWRQLASTNPLERFIKEIKRRANVIGIFRNDEAILRLAGALSIEQKAEWHIARR